MKQMASTKKTCIRCKKRPVGTERKELCSACYFRERRARDIQPCKNCGEMKSVESKSLGLCQGCYSYQRKHGKPRPNEVRKRSKIRECTNCGEERRIEAKGLCQRCYLYQKRHGIARPLLLQKGWCTRCKQKKARAQGMCHACYSYKRKHGVPRPSYLFKRDECKICGKPGRNYARGYCGTCYGYKKMMGVERPEYLWRGAVWCECGKQAIHTNVALRLATGDGTPITEKYNLCQDCHDLEFQP
jgi:hypothetical protein